MNWREAQPSAPATTRKVSMIHRQRLQPLIRGSLMLNSFASDPSMTANPTAIRLSHRCSSHVVDSSPPPSSLTQTTNAFLGVETDDLATHRYQSFFFATENQPQSPLHFLHHFFNFFQGVRTKENQLRKCVWSTYLWRTSSKETWSSFHLNSVLVAETRQVFFFDDAFDAPDVARRWCSHSHAEETTLETWIKH